MFHLVLALCTILYITNLQERTDFNIFFSTKMLNRLVLPTKISFAHGDPFKWVGIPYEEAA